MEEIIDSKKYRNFMVLIYSESKHYNFDDVMFNLKSFKYYAYIKHLPEEEELSEHFHAFIRLDNATTCNSIAKRLGVPVNMVQYVKNVRAGMRYLTHIDYENKIQYSINDVHISRLFQRKYLLAFEDVKTEEEIIQDIYFWLDNSHFDNYFEKLKYFTMFVNLNCYDTIFKRYRFEFIDYLKHNL